MANFTVRVPAADLSSPDTWGSRDSIKNMLQNIWIPHVPVVDLWHANNAKI